MGPPPEAVGQAESAQQFRGPLPALGPIGTAANPRAGRGGPEHGPMQSQARRGRDQSDVALGQPGCR